MPNLPQLSDLSRLVFILDRHPFGALACIVLASITLACIIVISRRK